MTGDISPIVQFAVAAASLAVTGAVPTVLVWLNSHLKLQKDSIMAQRVGGAVNAAAQLVISEISSVGAHNMSLSTKNSVIDSAIGKLSPGAHAAIDALGITPASIASRIDGEVTKVLGPTGGAPTSVK